MNLCKNKFFCSVILAFALSQHTTATDLHPQKEGVDPTTNNNFFIILLAVRTANWDLFNQNFRSPHRMQLACKHFKDLNGHVWTLRDTLTELVGLGEACIKADPSNPDNEEKREMISIWYRMMEALQPFQWVIQQEREEVMEALQPFQWVIQQEREEVKENINPNLLYLCTLRDRLIKLVAHSAEYIERTDPQNLERIKKEHLAWCQMLGTLQQKITEPLDPPNPPMN